MPPSEGLPVARAQGVGQSVSHRRGRSHGQQNAVGDRIVAQTWAEHRKFVLNRNAVREWSRLTVRSGSSLAVWRPHLGARARLAWGSMSERLFAIAYHRPEANTAEVTARHR